MLAMRWNPTLEFKRHWQPVFMSVLVAILALTAVKTASKVLKPGRTGEQSRTAFLRWRPQILALESGSDIYRAFNYPNPPIMALILKPLAKLPPLTGVAAWFLLKMMMAFSMAVMVFRMVELPAWGKALALALSLHPILGDLSHGNVNLFIAFLVFTGLDCYRRGWQLSAGLLVALAIACKVTPALFIPYFLWKRAWKTLLGISFGLALWWVIVPGAVLGMDYNRTLMSGWFEIMVKPFAIGGQITSEHPNQSLPGVLTRLFTEKPSFIEYSEDDGRPVSADAHTIVNLGPGAVDAVVKVAMLAFAAVMVWRARTRRLSGVCFAAECSMILLGMLLFSERTWKHHATTLLLPVSTLIAAAVTLKMKKVWFVLGAATFLSLMPSLMESSTQDLFLVYGTYTIVYLLLLAGQVMVMTAGYPIECSLDSRDCEPPQLA